MFNEDNTKVYFAIKEVVYNTDYAASIKLFQRLKNGWGALLSLKHQYYSKDKWKRELEKNKDFINTFKWNRNTSYSLTDHAAHYRNRNVVLAHYTEYLDYQLLNEYTKVRKFI